MPKQVFASFMDVNFYDYLALELRDVDYRIVNGKVEYTVDSTPITVPRNYGNCDYWVAWSGRPYTREALNKSSLSFDVGYTQAAVLEEVLPTEAKDGYAKISGIIGKYTHIMYFKYDGDIDEYAKKEGDAYAEATGVKTTAKKKALTVKWKKLSGVDGYTIQYGTSKSFNKSKSIDVKKASTVTKTIKKLKSKKTYYVRIRGYKNIGTEKFVGKWVTKKVKIK